MKIILFILLLGFSLSATRTQNPNEDKVLLAIFAHPDDELTVGPVLAKYASEGVKVYLAVATDGRLGTSNTKIPAGDELAAARKLELICAAEKLGIQPPITFGLYDQLKMTEGFGPFHNQMDTLRVRIRKLFEQLKPDAVITWNASGWTGHHDHRLVGAAVTEVYESRRWAKPAQLFYAGVPAQNIPAGKSAPLGVATVDKSFLTVAIPVSEADFAKAKQSSFCHQTQFSSPMLEGLSAQMKAVMQSVWYFRPHSGSTEPKTSLF